MKLQEMLQLRDSYQHLECPALPEPVYDDISKLLKNPNIPKRWVEALGFVGACNFVISKYANGACSNRRASKALRILAEHLPADAQPRSYPPAHQLQKEFNEALTQLIPFICGLRPASDAEAFRTPNRPHNYCQIKVGGIYEVSHYPGVDNDEYKGSVAVRLFGYLVAGIYHNMRDGVYEIWIDNYQPTHQSKYINVLCRALADFFGIKAPKFGTTSFISEPQSLDSEVTFVEFVKGRVEIRFGVAHNQDATPTLTPPLPPILTPPTTGTKGGVR